jgi:tol-pal system protein YbgF
METLQRATSGAWRPRVTALALLAATAVSLAGCASQVDLSSIRREQRMLARRIADARADIDRLNSEMARLRTHTDDSRYSSRDLPPTDAPGYDSREPYAQGSTPPESAAPGRDYGTGQQYGAGPEYGATAPGAAPAPGTAPAPGYGDPSGPPGGFAAGVPAEPAGGGGAGGGVQQDIALGNDSEYQQGLQSYSRGDYQRSVQSLRNYVSRNPRDPLVPVAQYWIGEAYFSQGKYNESILAFNEILVSWPDSERKPAALLRQADAFARTGDKIDARMILQKLMEDHPNTPEAAEARQQLQALGG